MILDGKAVSKKILDNLKVKVGNLSKQPHLVVILVGNNPASQIYVKIKNLQQKYRDKIYYYRIRFSDKRNRAP